MFHLDIHPRIADALEKAKLQNEETILCLSGPDLMRRTQLSATDINKLHKAIAQRLLQTNVMSAVEIYKCEQQSQGCRLTTGCSVLDSFLRGGILCHGITEIAGESASGKTQFCMQLSLTVQLPKSMAGLESGAFYLCTEHVFPNKRLVQMVNLLKRRTSDPQIKQIQFMDNIFIEHAAEIDDLWNCVRKKLPILLNGGRIKLVIIDSVAALFRCNAGKQVVQRAKQLSNFASHLHELSHKYSVPFVCVNQISAVIQNEGGSGESMASLDRQVKPALGLSWANVVTCRFMLLRTQQHVNINGTDPNGEKQCYEANVRTMEVLFAPHLPNTMCHFIVDSEGVKGL